MLKVPYPYRVEIWKNVQVNIHYTYTASTETNDTSEESPGIQL